MAKSAPSDTKLVFIQRSRTYADLVEAWFAAYGLRDRFSYFGGRGRRSIPTKPDPAGSLPLLQSLQPPFLVLNNLEDAELTRQIREILAARFPGAAWQVLLCPRPLKG